MTGDFIKGASYGLDKKFRMICLNDNYTTLTAFANDVSYDLVFVEPNEKFYRKGCCNRVFQSGNSRKCSACIGIC